MGGGAPGGPRYRIGNLASRKLLANPQGSRDNGSKIIQWDPDGGAEQQWVIDKGPHGDQRDVAKRVARTKEAPK